ncbi:MAG TPA: hypothetical protein EYP90_15350 [Chromatiaceae bacterium]|nr:hypothetical protein [Chromatiaceae bacterium]
MYETEAAINLGSTAVLRVLLPKAVLDRDARMRFFAYYAADGFWAVGGASNNGSTAVDWAARVLFRLENVLGRELGEHASSLIARSAEKVPPCSGGVYVLPFVAGERFPFRDPWLRFTVLGMSLDHDHRHVARALFEGISFVVKAMNEALRENGVEVAKAHCGGGGCQNPLMVRVLANVLCTPVVVYGGEVARAATALGAAVTLMRALGHVPSITKAELRAVREGVVGVVEPDRDLCNAYSECYSRFVRVCEALSSLMRELYGGGS